MNKKLKKGLTISTSAAMGMGIVLPTVSVLAAPVTANGWVLENGKWYYYVNGVKLANAWAKDSNGWCYLGADGTAIQEGWAKDSIGWCYIRNYNWVDHATWAKDSAGWQYIGANGYWDSSVAPKATNPIDDATAAVVKAEASKTQADVDAAKAAVEALKGAVPEAAALTARINAINVVFEVSSVSVVDATHVKVVFSQKVDQDTAEDTDNYEIGDLGISEAVLQDDGKTVILELDEEDHLSNDSSDDYTVKVTDVKSASGKVLPDYKKILNLYDNEKPTVESVEMTDSDTLTITFSESVTTSSINATNIKVVDEDGAKVSTDAPQRDDDDHNVVKITGLGNADSGDYSVVISNVKDLAGNKIVSTTEDFSIDEDTSAPKLSTIKCVSIDEDGKVVLKVTFNEPVKNNFDITAKDEDGSDIVGVVGKAVSGTNDKAYYVTFEEGNFVEDETYKVTVNSFEDKAGNDTTNKYKFVKFTNADSPELTSTEATVKTISGKKYAVLTFDQDVNGCVKNVGTFDAYYVDENGDEISTDELGSSDVKTSDDLSVLNDDQIAIALSGLDAGDYTVTLPENLVVVNGLGNDEVDITFTLSSDESEADNHVVDLRDDGTMDHNYLVEFASEVDSSALNPDNYTLDGDTVFSSARFMNSDKTIVRLTVADGAITDKDGITVEAGDDSHIFKTRNITDADGNDVEDFNSSKVDADTFDPVTFYETVRPSIEDVTLNSLTEAVVTFDEEIVNPEDVTKSDFQAYYYIDSKKYAVDVEKVADHEVVDGKSVFTITLDDTIDSDYTSIKIGTSSVFDGKDQYGNKGEQGTLYKAE